jgi:hypothetical protein
MAAKRSSPTLADFPSDLTTAVMADAARDADRVGRFLAERGIRGSPEKPLVLPERLLLHMGAALRLLSWVEHGLLFHGRAGLLEVLQAIQQDLQTLHRPDANPGELYTAVLRIFVERFAWHGRHDLDADVTLDELTDDAALDALAEYLWANRHAGAEADGHAT